MRQLWLLQIESDHRQPVTSVYTDPGDLAASLVLLLHQGELSRCRSLHVERNVMGDVSLERGLEPLCVEATR